MALQVVIWGQYLCSAFDSSCCAFTFSFHLPHLIHLVVPYIPPSADRIAYSYNLARLHLIALLANKEV